MRRSTTRARQGGGSRIAAWWDAVLAGESDEPHPIFGERISVRVTGERLVISGELERDEDRDALLQQARARIGHGIRELDAARLRIPDGHERTGLLGQEVVAAFRGPKTGGWARPLPLP